MTQQKDAGRFRALVRDNGFPTWIDLSINDESVTTMSIEELHDLKYVVDSALRIALGKTGEQK